MSLDGDSPNEDQSPAQTNALWESVDHGSLGMPPPHDDQQNLPADIASPANFDLDFSFFDWSLPSANDDNPLMLDFEDVMSNFMPTNETFGESGGSR